MDDEGNIMEYNEKMFFNEDGSLKERKTLPDYMQPQAPTVTFVGDGKLRSRKEIKDYIGEKLADDLEVQELREALMTVRESLDYIGKPKAKSVQAMTPIEYIEEMKYHYAIYENSLTFNNMIADLDLLLKKMEDNNWTDVRDGLPTRLDEDYIVTAIHTYGDGKTVFEDIEVFETDLLRETDPTTGQRFGVPFSKYGKYEVIAWQRKPEAYERRTV